MRTRFSSSLLFLSALLSPLAMFSADSTATITVDASKPGIRVSPKLYGIFFEEINRAGDGGIYAEMIQNRSFEDANFPVAWSLVKGGDADAVMSLDKAKPLNAKNPTSLRLEVTKPGERAGVANDGFKGVPQRPHNDSAKWRARWDETVAKSTAGLNVVAGKEYDLSVYATAANFAGPLDVTLEKQDGTALASGSITGLGSTWKKFTLALTPTASETNARLVVSTKKTGTVWLDMVSLFPKETWKGRPNGLRPDLMEMVAAMHPAFVRFPGGCFVEGDKLYDAARWKNSIGDIAERPGHYNLWGYESTDGLGFHEYLQMCEDLGAAPLFVINCGMSHEEQGKSNRHETVPVNPEFVQDALDAIDYANGPVTSKWGALRAKAGHPAPFNLKMMEIGNENGGPVYYERYALFHDAIKAKDPTIQLVACDWAGAVPHNRPLDLIDSHDYNTPQSFARKATRYDDYDRKGPKVYFGEYAVTRGGAGKGNMRAALGEAAFMTGLERNSDVVRMSSYAPLFVEPSWETWNPNAIHFDSSRTFGTPSYYTQAMFAANRGDVNLPVAITQPGSAGAPIKGVIGIGTWATQAEFKDIKVTKNGATLFSSDFSKDLTGWKTIRGTWKVENGAVQQTSDTTDARIVVGDPSWSDYTLELKARKLGGREGFLVSFGLDDDKSTNRWNIGGWDNSEHGLESDLAENHVRGSIENDHWYDIRIELNGASIKCYLDGKLIHDVKRAAPPSLFAVAGKKEDTGETILKIVNTLGQAQDATITLQGTANVGANAKEIVLASQNADDENSFESPTKVAPKEQTIPMSGAQFQHNFPPFSITVLRLKTSH